MHFESNFLLSLVISQEINNLRAEGVRENLVFLTKKIKNLFVFCLNLLEFEGTRFAWVVPEH